MEIIKDYLENYRHLIFQSSIVLIVGIFMMALLRKISNRYIYSLEGILKENRTEDINRYCNKKLKISRSINIIEQMVFIPIILYSVYMILAGKFYIENLVLEGILVSIITLIEVLYNIISWNLRRKYSKIISEEDMEWINDKLDKE